VLLGLLCWLAGGGDALAAGTFVVDGADSGCSDTAPGAGTEGNPPYCTISAAAAARGGPGTTILVKPAIYREQVTVRASGAEGSPFVFQALGPGVVVDGADDFSDPALWTPATGTVWQAVGVTWFPRQVFVDGAPLTLLSTSVVEPAAVPPGTFGYASGGSIYVNLGGDNPGTHQTLISRRGRNFDIDARSWVTIDGFTITRGAFGIYANASSTGATSLTLTHNTVTFVTLQAIDVSGFTNALIGSNVVSGGGIRLGRCGSAIIQDNEVFRNSNDGIRIDAAASSLIQRNTVHDNRGTGIKIQSSSNTLSLQNRSWHNGGHGFHLSRSVGSRHVGDVAWGNAGRGFSVGWEATDTHIFNSIGADNGPTGEFDLFVDTTAAAGFASNFNLFWNRTSQAPIKFSGTTYTTLAAFTAGTGQDAASLQADPRFRNPVGGDFRLLPGSPAIDSADSSVPHWAETDAAGNPRVDDPATPNTGAGPVPYADRGALEYVPSAAPVAALTVAPSSGPAPLTVTLDASGSSAAAEETIVSYAFDAGDGSALIGPQPGATAPHTYATPGTYTATVTVTDTTGASSTASATVTVADPGNLVRNPSFETDTSGWTAYGGSTLQRVPGGQEGAVALEVRGPASTATFGINDSPNWVATTGAAGTHYRFTAWVRARTEVATGRARIRVREYLNGVLVGTATYSPFVPLTPAWQLLLTEHVAQATGSTLDVQILDYPGAAGEVFQVDSIAIVVVP
jgi:parallel beta-helix repeat protein